ncbi:MAG: BrnT family toxin [Treponema sp.]|nr:BrnT family toxin [Treponema sp.]
MVRQIVWDEDKNIDNKHKHKIGFETARFVFADPNRLWRYDRSESNISGEDRWQTLGMAEGVVFAVYTENGKDNETRLITARLATKAERRIYNGYYRINNQGWSEAD